MNYLKLKILHLAKHRLNYINFIFYSYLLSEAYSLPPLRGARSPLVTLAPKGPFKGIGEDRVMLTPLSFGESKAYSPPSVSKGVLLLVALRPAEGKVRGGPEGGHDC